MLCDYLALLRAFQHSYSIDRTTNARCGLILTGSRQQPASVSSQATLIKRVYEFDPLVCRKCGGQMKIISFIKRDQLCSSGFGYASASRTQPSYLSLILSHKLV